jgi:hypothetical protein
VFILSNDATWVIDLRSAPGSVKKVKPTQEQTDNGVTITVEDSDFISMLTGKANAQQLVRYIFFLRCRIFMLSGLVAS